MALKIKTNVARKKAKNIVSDMPKSEIAKKPTYNVKPISNGFLVSKSWTDSKGNYQNEEIYHKDNPIDDSEMTEGDSEEMNDEDAD